MQASRRRLFARLWLFGGLWLCTVACEEEDPIRGDFYYLNGSGLDVIVERYDVEPDTAISLEIFEIKSKRVYKRRLDSVGPNNVACEDFRPPMETDSLVFTYSNDSIVSFTLLDTTSSNPMLLRNYSSQKVARNFCEFRFTIK